MVDEVYLSKLGFVITGTVSQDRHTKLLNVNGNVAYWAPGTKWGASLKIFKNMGFSPHELPVAFGHVKGNFSINTNGLKSLKGCPNIVDGHFDCDQNDLVDLQGAPEHTGSFYARSCNLTSSKGVSKTINGGLYIWGNTLKKMDHLPLKAQIISMDYHEKMPLLGCLATVDKSVLLSGDVPVLVQQIVDKYAGKGRSGALLAAAELIRAGYKEHAQW